MNRLAHIAIMLIAISCSEDQAATSPNFVVEGFIVAGEPVNNIKVKGISPITSEEVTSEPLTSAQVEIGTTGNVFPLNFNAGTGLYEYLEADLNISIGGEYSLEVQVGDRTATATTMVPPAPTGLSLPDSILEIPQLRLSFSLADQITDLFFEERITLTWDEKPGQSFYVVIEQQDDVVDPILPEDIPSAAVELLSSFRFISEPSEEGRFDIIGVALTNYGRHVAKVFTVNQEYVDLFENLEQDSRDLNEPPSNVINANGIFTSFAVDSLEFIVRR